MQFAGASSSPAPEVTADGRFRGLYLGTDYTVGSKTFGVAVARHQGDVDFTGEGLAMDGLNLNMTSVMPYGRLSPWDGGAIWGTFGMGWGTTTPDGGNRTEETPFTMRTAAGGVASDVARTGSLVFRLKADGYYTETESDSTARVHGLEIGVHGLRVALNTRADLALSPSSRLVPSLEAGARLDRGDIGAGAGMEMGGGLMFTNSRVGLNLLASGRVLVAHQESEYSEWGAGFSIRYGARARNANGLSLALEPSWGQANSRVDALWRDDGVSFARGAGLGLEQPRRVNMDVAYGIPAFGTDGSIQLFGQSSVETAAKQLRVGTRFSLPRALDRDAMQLELLAERRT